MLAGVALQAVQQVGAARGQAAMDKVENGRIKAYNKAVAQQAAKSFNEINLQKSVLAQQTGEALAATKRQGMTLKAARGLQAAGTDTLGASVEQNILDVDQKVMQSQDLLTYNQQLSDVSLNAQLQAVADGAGFSLRAEKQITNQWGAALGQAVGSGAMQMFGASFGGGGGSSGFSLGSLFGGSGAGTGSTQAGYTSDAFKSYVSRQQGIS